MLPCACHQLPKHKSFITNYAVLTPSKKPAERNKVGPPAEHAWEATSGAKSPTPNALYTTPGAQNRVCGTWQIGADRQLSLVERER